MTTHFAETRHPTPPGRPEDDSFARSVLDSQVSRIAVIDRNGIIIAVNEPWREFARENGADEVTIQGVGIDYFATAGQSGEQEVLDSLGGIREILDGNRKVYRDEYVFDIPDGRFWFEMFVTPLNWGEGGAVIAHHSIDDRKRAELLILQQRTHLDAIFQSADEGIIAIASSGQIARINDTALNIFRLDRKQAAGRKFDQLLDGALAELDRYVRKSVRGGETTRDLQLEVDLPSGHRVLLCTIRPLEVEGYPRHEALVVFRDATKLFSLQQQVDDQLGFGDLIGKSTRLREVHELIKRVAPSTTTVLLLGESGTGKGVIASLIHRYSERRDGPFVAVNCAALSDALLQSELFGHVKGAFTSAVADRTGRFQLAAGGTLFLDEIGDISPAVQVALLRVLEEREFERVGDTRTLRADVRVVAATNRNLHERVQRGEFREDLFYRLNVVTVHVPPLRDRAVDIPLLADHFRTLFNREMGARVEQIAPGALELMQAYDWPGNVRELRNAIERAFILCHGSTLEPEHLPAEILYGSRTSDAESAQTFPSLHPTATARSAAASEHSRPHPRRRPADPDEVKRVLAEHDGNVTHTARALGYTRQYVHYLIKKHGIDRTD